MIRHRFLVPILVLAGAAAIPASATLTTYASQSAFVAATTGNQTFTNITFPSGPLTNPFQDLVTSTIFSATTGLSGDSNPSGWPPAEVLEVTKCASGTNCPTLTVTLPSAATAFDMFFGPQDFSNPTVTVDNSGGDHFVNGTMIQPNGSTPIFFGFVTSAPITTFTIVGAVPADQWTFDDVQVGEPAATPEAGTLFLLGGGLLMLRFGRRWLPRRSSTPRPATAAAPVRAELCLQSARG